MNWDERRDVMDFYDAYPKKDIPDDIKPFYRSVRASYHAYVCPCCKMIFSPGWAGMPQAFRAHIDDFVRGGGCMFRPSSKPLSRRRSQDDVDF